MVLSAVLSLDLVWAQYLGVLLYFPPRCTPYPPPPPLHTHTAVKVEAPLPNSAPFREERDLMLTVRQVAAVMAAAGVEMSGEFTTHLAMCGFKMAICKSW
jgi:hypothetical protein